MDRLLSKLFLPCFLFLFGSAFSQDDGTEKNVHGDKDYKDPKQFENFRKKKNLIAAWQINQLKEGAVVIRLKTNKKLIDALREQGNNELALEKEKEQYAVNVNTYYAYRYKLKFAKVYFILSNHTDSLLNGVRTGIFLDSALKVDPTITMNEKFYLIAERDYGYNSSIGFVKEDSAKKVIETGNPVREMAVILKNKYGHQLKGPFPYCIKEKNFSGGLYTMPISVNTNSAGGVSFNYMVDLTYFADLKAKDKGEKLLKKTFGNSTVKLKKQDTYEKISEAVDQMNDELNRFYRNSPKPDTSKLSAEILPFLY